MNNRHQHVLPLSGIFAAAICAAAMAKDYQTYVIRPPINNDPILKDETLPVQYRNETVMEVLCARGEYEPASFLIETVRPLE